MRVHQYGVKIVCDDLFNVLHTHANELTDVLGSVKNIKQVKNIIVKEKQKTIESSRLVKKTAVSSIGLTYHLYNEKSSKF